MGVLAALVGYAAGVDQGPAGLSPRIGDVDRAADAGAVGRARRYVLAVLRGRVGPRRSAHVGKKALDIVLRLGAAVSAGREPGGPLSAPVDDEDDGARLDRATMRREERAGPVMSA